MRRQEGLPCSTKEVYCVERKFTSQLGKQGPIKLACDQVHKATACFSVWRKRRRSMMMMVRVVSVRLLRAARCSDDAAVGMPALWRSMLCPCSVQEGD
jgi:hypothetical protein